MDESLTCSIITSIAFFFNFVAYNAAFNSSTNYSENVYSFSMLILYLSFAVSSISLTPYFLYQMHPKYAMIIGSMGFIVYISCSIVYNKQLLYFASFINGIGASLLWSGSQQIIIRCANIYEIKYQLPHNSNIGYFEGIILCSFNMSYCIGNIVPIFLYNHDLSIKCIYIILCFIGLLTPIILININHKIIRGISFNKYVSSRIYDPIHDDSFANTPSYNTFNCHINQYTVTPINDENEMEIQIGTNEYKYCGSIYLWRDNRLQCIILLSIYWGFWLEFMYYEFPQIINHKIEQIEILVFIGFVDGILSFIIGKLSDYIHRFYLVIIALFIQIIIYWIYYGYSPQHTYSMPFFCVIGMLMGISDSILTTTMFSMYPLFMNQQIESCTNCLFWQSLGIALSFLLRLIGFGGTKSRMIMYFMSVFLCSIPFFVSRIAAITAKSRYDTNK